MTWLAWRQFRAQGLVVAGAALAVAVTLVLTRSHVAATAGDLSTGYQSLRLLGTGLVGVPALIGAFWGAPLVARELEAGTHRLVWTQGVTRSRWLGTKLAVIGAAAALLTAVFSLTFTWWSVPLDELGNRIGTANFGQRGIVPIAYVLFALALGTLLGLVIGRTLPAMAATLVGFFVVRFAFQLLVRPHLGSPITVTRPTEMYGLNEGAAAASGAWVLASHSADAAGHRVSAAAVDRAVAHACPITRSTGAGDLVRCAHRLGFQDVVRIQPASRFWVLQSWEAAVFLLLAAVLAGLCFWWLRHRTS